MALPRTFIAVSQQRLGLYSSRTGAFLRWLTPAVPETNLPTLSTDKNTVFFIAGTADHCHATYRMAAMGGPRTLVRRGQEGGGQPIAVGPGIAGHTWCIATQEIVWTVGDRTGYIGTRGVGPNGLAFSPDGRRLAVSTYNDVEVVTLTGEASGLPGPTGSVPCPHDMPGCRTREPAYDRNGTLHYVAIAADSSRAVVVRLRQNRATTLFRLPRVSNAYRLFVAPSGALLVSGDADTDSAASDFVATWDGVVVHEIARQFIQPAW